MPRENKRFLVLFFESLIFYKRYVLPLLMISAIFFIPLEFLNTFFWNNTALIQKLSFNFSSMFVQCLSGLIILIMILFFLLYFLALLKGIHCADTAEPIRVFSIYSIALKRLKDYLWIKLMYLFKVISWSFLIILPGIIFAGLYGFAPLVLLIDGKKGEEALRFSKEIVKPFLIQYFDYLFFVVLLLFSFFAPLIIILDLWINQLLSKEQFSIAHSIYYGECLLIIGAGIYFVIFYYFLYKELKLRMESQEVTVG